MMRALLDGRKTQTRHAVNPQPFEMVQFIGRDDKPTGEFGWCPSARYITKHITCPYGKPGDRLYVRETWAQPAALDPGPTVYRADYSACIPAGYENVPLAKAITRKPSIHMLRALPHIRACASSIAPVRFAPSRIRTTGQIRAMPSAGSVRLRGRSGKIAR
jgi:hypothetical protein